METFSVYFYKEDYFFYQEEFLLRLLSTVEILSSNLNESSSKVFITEL